MEMFATLKQTYSTEYHRVPFAFKDSMIHCICNSHYLSHFAAFFIDARTKRSVVESFKRIKFYTQTALMTTGV